MKTLAIAATLTVASLLAMPAAQARPRLTGEQQLARMLDGRQAGQPVSCIPYTQTHQSTVIDKTAIVYRVGGTLYVNRPTNADRLDRDDVLVTQITTSQLCNVDTVHLHDRVGSGLMWNGFVGLNEFVPYRKVATAN